MSNNNIKLKNFTKNVDSYYNQLRDKVISYNISKVGTYGKKEPWFLGYFDDADTLIGGLYGYFVVHPSKPMKALIYKSFGEEKVMKIPKKML